MSAALIKVCRWLPMFGCCLALAAGVTEDPRYRTALAKFDAGDLKGSHRLFKQIEERYPDDPGVLNNLGIIAAELGQWALAARLFERAIATDPVIATSHGNLQALYAHRAAHAYQRALALESMEVAAPQYQMIRTTPTAKPAQTLALTDALLAAKEIEKPLVEEPDKPAPAAPQPADADIADSVKRWARAWAGKDLDDYFASYADDYRPSPGTDHENWREQRRRRILGPKRIDVAISSLRIERNGDGAADVTFEQRYRSDLLASTVTKRLLMRDDGDGWKITRERIVRRR